MTSNSATDVVLRTIQDGVAVLTLNRPDRLNGWTADLEKRYFGFLEEAATDPAVRAIVVTGAGKGFCAGLDMGLVNRVVAPESLVETADGYARELAVHSSPASMAVMKRQVYHHQELDLAAAMRDTNELMAESLTRPDFREGVASFVEKRPPRFKPLGK